MKCGACRKETTWYIEVDKRIKCKKCKRNAPPNSAIYKCRHKFADANGVFTPKCLNCEVELSPNLQKRPPPAPTAQNLVQTLDNIIKSEDTNNVNFSTDDFEFGDTSKKVDEIHTPTAMSLDDLKNL
jgi:hypothetical protein